MTGFVCEERLAFGPWPALERAVARLVQHAGFRDVSIVGGSGDQGADVVGTKDGARWVLQSKFRSSGGADSAGPREAVRVMSSYGANSAVAVCNSYFTADAYEYVAEAKKNGLDIRLWNGAYLLKFAKALPRASVGKLSLRPYQVEAIDAIERHRGDGAASGLVIMATGLGKSVVASQIIANELERNTTQEVLVLAHTIELVRQLEISTWTQLNREHSTHLWTEGEQPAYSGGVVFATWQSVQAALKRSEDLRSRFGLIIVDEAHHAPSSSFRLLLDNLAPNFKLGMTATPWRGDEQSLVGLFGPPVFSLDIVEGMQRGFLAEVDYRLLTDGIDWDDIARKSREGLTVRDLNVLLLLPDRDIAMVDMIAEKMAAIKSPRAIGFCRSIEHASRLQPLLAAKGIRVAMLHSQLPRDVRFRNLSAFRIGEIDMLLSIEMLNEGIDVPDVNVVAFMRVTHSRRIFVQQLGRGLRVRPGKTTLLVLDFVADIRRVAATISINRDAKNRSGQYEIVRFLGGGIIKFDNDRAATFFDEYLADVADVESLDESARLRFP